MDSLLPFRTLSPGARNPKATSKTNKNYKLSLKARKERLEAKQREKENDPPVQTRKQNSFCKFFDANLMTSDESSASNDSDIGKATAKQFSFLSLNTQESSYILPMAESTRYGIPEVQRSCAELKMTTLYTADSGDTLSSNEYYTALPGPLGCDESIVCLSDSPSEIMDKTEGRTNGMAKPAFESVIISSDESDYDVPGKNLHHDIFSSIKKMGTKKIHETVVVETDSEDDSNAEEKERNCNLVVPASPQYNGSVADCSVGGSTSSMEQQHNVKTFNVVIPRSPRKDSGSSLISEDSTSVRGKPKNIGQCKLHLEDSKRSSFSSVISSSVVGDPPIMGKKRNLEMLSSKAITREKSNERELNESSWKEDFHLVMPESSVQSEEHSMTKNSTPTAPLSQQEVPVTITKQKYDDIARWLFLGRKSSGGSSSGESSSLDHAQQQLEQEQSPQRQREGLKHPRVSKLSVVKRSSFGSESEENFNALIDSTRKKRNDIKKKSCPTDDSFINDNSDEASPDLTKYHSLLTKSIRSEVHAVKKSVRSIKKRQILTNFDDSDDSDELCGDRVTRPATPTKLSFRSDRICSNRLSSTDADDSESESDIPNKGNKIMFSDNSDTEEKKRATSKTTDGKKQVHPNKTRKNIVINSSDEDSSASSRSDAELVTPIKPKKSIWRKSIDLSESSTSGDSSSTSSSELKPQKIQAKAPQPVSRKVPPVKPKQVAALKTPQTLHSPIQTFLSSLSGPSHQPGVRDHPEATIYNKNFKTKKEELTRRLYKLFNREVFECRLPQDMVLEWNPRLVKTAGLCSCKLVKKSGVTDRSAKIVLSTKVNTSPDRLRDTLIHEMCHAAVWLLNNVSGGHGPYWKAWACKAMKRFPELPLIRRCHSYEIETKFTYKCTVCSYSFGRHSKSLDVEKKRCGKCYGTFEVFVNSKSQNQEKKVLKAPKAPSAFALFVKENYGTLKQEHSNMKHGDLMKKLSEKFASLKVK